MLVTLSPAKKLNWAAAPSPRMLTTPQFHEDATHLAALALEQGADGLKKLMKISDKLAVLNHDRFAAFQPDPAPEMTRPAVFGFDGDTYTGLDARSLDSDALNWAGSHLRILSGLYGVLRPFDALQAYRLEMGSRLGGAHGRSLYEYWGSKLAEALNADAQAVGVDILVNCASEEYFRAVERSALKLRVITPVFMEIRDGAEPKIISFFAKKARGAMARFIMEHRLSDPRALTEFDTAGYHHDPAQSTHDRPVFLRES
ncbi:MAG: peroxide stress protein YaaA [Rhodobacteraceae bacterium]|nr:peroxide stress protein YaaA [Paracoccaceae bacterium]